MPLEFKETNQRPFPLPASPWVLKQRWDYMLFLHWPVSEKLLSSHIPTAFSLDLFQGRAWISIVPFLARNTRLHGLPPFPFYHSYLELNIRTYVTYNGVPGIYFFSLGADKWPIVIGAGAASFLPYHHAQMKMSVQNNTVYFQSECLRSRKMPEMFRASYSPSSPVFLPEEGALDWWLLERYCFWVQKGSQVFRGDIHHNRWRVTEAACVIYDHTAPSFLPDHALSDKPLAHFSHQKNVFTWPLKKEQ